MKSFQSFTLALAVLMAVGCQSFDRTWRKATAAPMPQDFSGPWEGEWVSEANGHRGKLRCVVTPGAAPSDPCAFHYWATWGIFRGSFTTAYPVTSVGQGRWQFKGASDLGTLGGVYHHEGEATTERFQATYQSSRGDHGTMTMARP